MSNAAVYYKDGSTWRCAWDGVHIKDGSTWRTATNVYYNDAGTWREVHRVYQAEVSLTDSQAGPATAQINWNTTGAMILSNQAGTVSSTYWLWPAGTAPSALEYYIRFTVLSGAFTSSSPSGSTISRLDNTNRFGYVFRNTVGTETVTFLAEISTDASMVNVVSATTHVLTATTTA